ncbi:MAG: cupin domain-containing protein [Chromatiales bacterium]|nr:MAG: cupin domain-containing protein [Chromatiales bacterium]
MSSRSDQGDSRPGIQTEFGEQGYTIVRGLFTRAECLKALASIFWNRGAMPSGWYKEGALSNPGIFCVARSDRIVEELARVLGPDIILWGARLIIRRPKGVHPWHSDAESASSSGFASVWVGLTGTTRDTSLKLVPGSHKFGAPIQQLATENNVAREDITDQVIADWSTTYGPRSQIAQTDLGNGDALIFDGRLWHGSDNTTLARFRTCLLLQYARADVPVRVPDNDYSWPWEYRANRRPQCLVVSGEADSETNRILPGPVVMRQKSPQSVSTRISAVQTDHPNLGSRGFRSYGLIEGATPDLRYMESHYSALAPGASPHRPHGHSQEEILVVVDGEAELVVEAAAGSDQFRKLRARPGAIIYYPSNWRHTLTNPGDRPVTYLMFKWLTDESQSKKTLQNVLIEGLADGRRPQVRKRTGLGMKILLEDQTHYLRKLHAHRTLIAPGQGYASHADAYDIGIVLFQGKVETLGQEVEAPAFVYYAAGEMHGMKNIGDQVADYIVFEFHGKHGEAYIPLGGKIAKAVRDPRLVVRFAKDKLQQLFDSRL